MKTAGKKDNKQGCMRQAVREFRLINFRLWPRINTHLNVQLIFNCPINQPIAMVKIIPSQTFRGAPFLNRARKILAKRRPFQVVFNHNWSKGLQDAFAVVVGCYFSSCVGCYFSSWCEPFGVNSTPNVLHDEVFYALTVAKMAFFLKILKSLFPQPHYNKKAKSSGKRAWRCLPSWRHSVWTSASPFYPLAEVSSSR